MRRSEPFERWLATSGESAPDFASLPSCANLPPPDWDAFRHWWLGSIPDPPDMSIGGDAVDFGRGATLGYEVLAPAGDGPFPVLITQRFHRGWALVARRRGWLVVCVCADDARDDTDTFGARWPGHDWSRIARRGWALCRGVDIAASVPSADMTRVAVTGHSRNGKASLVAAALDERIEAVVASSPGAGGSLPARLFGDDGFGESIEHLTWRFPDWFHPRLRFFAGREDRLRTDVHAMVARIAPRRLLLSTAVNDGCESYWPLERTVDAVEHLWPEGGIDILYRPGGHETDAALIETYLDWLDGEPVQQRRLSPAPAVAGELHEPPRGDNPGEDYGAEPAHVAHVLGRTGERKRSISFGEYLRADIWSPDANATSGVLWLHPWSFPTGYTGQYRDGPHPYDALRGAGFAVWCHDHIGFGGRIDEARRFAARHPEWSLLAKMVRDARAALDVFCAEVERVWVVGFSLGAIVAAHLDDPRPVGAVLICPSNAHPAYPLGPAPAASWTGREVFAVTPTLDRHPPVPLPAHAEIERPEGFHGLGSETMQIVVDWLRARA